MSDYHPNLDGPAEPIGLAMDDGLASGREREEHPMKTKDIIKKLRHALKDCCDLFDELEAKKGVDGLQRAIVEYRYNGRAALKLREEEVGELTHPQPESHDVR